MGQRRSSRSDGQSLQRRHGVDRHRQRAVELELRRQQWRRDCDVFGYSPIRLQRLRRLQRVQRLRRPAPRLQPSDRRPSPDRFGWLCELELRRDERDPAHRVNLGDDAHRHYVTLRCFGAGPDYQRLWRHERNADNGVRNWHRGDRNLYSQHLADGRQQGDDSQRHSEPHQDYKTLSPNGAATPRKLDSAQQLPGWPGRPADDRRLPHHRHATINVLELHASRIRAWASSIPVSNKVDGGGPSEVRERQPDDLWRRQLLHGFDGDPIGHSRSRNKPHPASNYGGLYSDFSPDHRILSLQTPCKGLIASPSTSPGSSDVYLGDIVDVT